MEPHLPLNILAGSIYPEPLDPARDSALNEVEWAEQAQRVEG